MPLQRSHIDNSRGARFGVLGNGFPKLLCLSQCYDLDWVAGFASFGVSSSSPSVPKDFGHDWSLLYRLWQQIPQHVPIEDGESPGPPVVDTKESFVGGAVSKHADLDHPTATCAFFL